MCESVPNLSLAARTWRKDAHYMCVSLSLRVSFTHSHTTETWLVCVCVHNCCTACVCECVRAHASDIMQRKHCGLLNESVFECVYMGAKSAHMRRHLHIQQAGGFYEPCLDLLQPFLRSAAVGRAGWDGAELMCWCAGVWNIGAYSRQGRL